MDRLRQRYVKVHSVKVRAVDDQLWLTCEAGDFERALGSEATPDQIARATDAHWGTPLGVRP